jgi:hypothetical protein
MSWRVCWVTFEVQCVHDVSFCVPLEVGSDWCTSACSKTMHQNLFIQQLLIKYGVLPRQIMNNKYEAVLSLVYFWLRIPIWQYGMSYYRAGLVQWVWRHATGWTVWRSNSGVARFSVRVETDTGAHSACYTMGYRAIFPRLQRPGRGVDLPLLFSAEAKERVQLYFCSPSLDFMACSRENFTF